MYFDGLAQPGVDSPDEVLYGCDNLCLILQVDLQRTLLSRFRFQRQLKPSVKRSVT